jgi:pimeloyl-ACP methyl ester carboxylesterase
MTTARPTEPGTTATSTTATSPPPALAGVTHEQVDVDGLSVHVALADRTGGQGAPLVLLHGWPQHWWCWRHVVPLLSERYRLVMPDLRGHGWTDAPAGGYDKEQLADDLLGLLDALDLRRVGLVGHDWGGWSGFLACLRAPERFSAFLALGIVHPWQAPSAARAVNAWRMAYQVALSTPLVTERALRATPAVIERAIRAGTVRQEAFTPADLRAFAEVLQQPARARATVALYRTFLLRESPAIGLGRYRDRRLTVPTRLLVGDGDPVAAGPLLDGWQEHADDMTVRVLPGVGHFVPEEAPRAVAEQARLLFG